MKMTALAILLTAAAVCFADEPTAPPAQVVRIELMPASLELSRPGDQRKALVLGVTETGETIDLTPSAKIEIRGDIAKAVNDGFFEAVEPGSGSIEFSAAGLSAELPVKIAQGGDASGMSFFRDISPVINKVGCTAGACHGAAKGKNGFKLSLRGYDPDYDYKALLYDLSGRRFNRVDPAKSLMLAKPTQQVAHGGGLRLELGSRYYDSILQWISEGVPYGDPSKDKVVELAVLPEEILMHSPGREQSILIVAKYADGSTRDVTREAHAASSNTETVAVDGSLVSGIRQGESTLLIRYEGKFATTPVTVLNPKDGFEWTALPQDNYIDKLIDAKLKRVKIQASPPATDAELVRRLYLDLTGKLPKPEVVRAYLEDSTPSGQKRARLIDRLIGSPEYVDYWTLKWGDLLRSNRKFMSDKGMWEFREWLRQSFSDNKPYDQFVRELLTAKGSSFANPAANFYRVARDPKEAMETTTQLFLGVRMVCAQCHDHPFERWTQDQYYEMSAFFAAVGVRPGFQSGEELVYLKRADNVVKHPKDGRVVEPKYLVATAGAPPAAGDGDRREALVDWLTSKQNPFFAMAISNRVFSYFMGKGIIDPVDDIRASNPPTNPELLQALTQDFTDHDFDLRHLMRTIVSSRAYRASYVVNEWNQADTINFSHFTPRRLSAEQLADGVAMATGSSFAMEDSPEDFTPVQSPDPHAGMDGFLELFGRPQRETACECERKTDISLPQAMNLVNGPTLAEAIADPDGRLARLIVNGASDTEVIEELYLATLGRLPTSNEMDLAATHLAKGESRAAAAQDLLWALLNSNAFLFNR